MTKKEKLLFWILAVLPAFSTFLFGVLLAPPNTFSGIIGILKLATLPLVSIVLAVYLTKAYDKQPGEQFYRGCIMAVLLVNLIHVVLLTTSMGVGRFA